MRRTPLIAGALVLALHAQSSGATKTGVPNDPLFEAQWGMRKIQAPEAWLEPNATGRGIEIAVVDSGVDMTHEDFQCRDKFEVLPGSNIGSKRRPDDPQDYGTHGTMVAGVAAACTDNGIGVVGVAPDATLVPIRVVAALRRYSAFNHQPYDEAMARGVEFATAAGAHVVNLSLGDGPPHSHLGVHAFPQTEKALARATRAGVVVIAAAGNFVQPLCEYPAMSRRVVCVVATDRNDLRGYYSDFPVNADPGSDEPGLEPVVAAPGGQGTTCAENVVSTWLQDSDAQCYDGPYESLHAGTSLAAPHVAGVAALLYERVGGTRTWANAELIVKTIVETADDLYTPGWDPIVGFGRVNALAAVRAIPASR